MSEHIDRYAVFGNPIKHSQSPAIHALFAQQTGQKLKYTAELVALDNFEAAVRDFAKHGGKGLNITVPFKQAAYEFASTLSSRAQQAGAVNTLIINDDDFYGDNTDGVGLERDLLHNHGLTLSGKRILLLGAGGAGRGVLAALLTNYPRQLTIANRTPEKAIELAHAFSSLGNVHGCGFADLNQQNYDIIINATSASLQGELPPLSASLIHADTFCYDMMYAKEPTLFMRWATSNHAGGTSDGLGMLVEQAAESFWLWRNIRPEIDPVITAIRALL
jgi:shikimate dehydrogenase